MVWNKPINSCQDIYPEQSIPSKPLSQAGRMEYYFIHKDIMLCSFQKWNTSQMNMITIDSNASCCSSVQTIKTKGLFASAEHKLLVHHIGIKCNIAFLCYPFSRKFEMFYCNINEIVIVSVPLQFPQGIQISSAPQMLVLGFVDLSLQEHFGSWWPIWWSQFGWE